MSRPRYTTRPGVAIHPDTYAYLDAQRNARDHERGAHWINLRLGTLSGSSQIRDGLLANRLGLLVEARRLRARERARFARSYARRWQAGERPA